MALGSAARAPTRPPQRHDSELLCSLIGRVGNDPFGAEARRLLAGYGIGANGIRIDEGAGTGIAIIHVEPSGENAITIIGGANLAMDDTDVERSRAVLGAAKVVLLQLEVRPRRASARPRARGRPERR